MECIGNILQIFFRELGIDKPIHRYQALVVWKDVVGPKISSVTEPKRISNGRMFVKVASDAWRTELAFHKKDIIEKLNGHCGKGIIQDIIWI